MFFNREFVKVKVHFNMNVSYETFKFVFGALSREESPMWKKSKKNFTSAVTPMKKSRYGYE